VDRKENRTQSELPHPGPVLLPNPSELTGQLLAIEKEKKKIKNRKVVETFRSGSPQEIDSRLRDYFIEKEKIFTNRNLVGITPFKQEQQ